MDVGSGGDDDVSVVASLVGLNLLDVAFGEKVGGDVKVSAANMSLGTYRPLLDEAVVPEVFEHCLLCGAQIFRRIVLLASRHVSAQGTSTGMLTHLAKLRRGQH